MALSENRFELIKTYKARQDKFAYYVMGLSVAAIGFSLSKTFDSRLNSNHVYLGIAIICWFISIISAIRWIIAQLKMMEINLDLTDVLGGYNNFVQIDEPTKHELKHRLKKKLEKSNKRGGRSYKLMLLMFLVGVGAFITWRLFEMI